MLMTVLKMNESNFFSEGITQRVLKDYKTFRQVREKNQCTERPGLEVASEPFQSQAVFFKD
jgi:hypothetical protein